MFIITRNKEGREQRERERGEKTRKEKTNRSVKGRDIDRPINLPLFALGFKQQAAMSLVYLGSSAVKHTVLQRLLSFRDLPGS